MKAVPILRVSDLARALDFYTRTLTFRRSHPAEPGEVVVELVAGDMALLLSVLDGDQRPGTNVCVRVDDVDAVFRTLVARGLPIPDDDDSPVHRGPVAQPWGWREFYVTDPDGNTLRFGEPIAPA